MPVSLPPTERLAPHRTAGQTSYTQFSSGTGAQRGECLPVEGVEEAVVVHVAGQQLACRPGPVGSAAPVSCRRPRPSQESERGARGRREGGADDLDPLARVPRRMIPFTP